MKRDMDLLRKILFAIEDQYKPGEIYLFGLSITGYDSKVVAEHCNLLHQQGLISGYQAFYGNDTIQSFRVGNLSNAGYDYLETIRDDEVWEKTKAEVKKKKLPETIEWIAKISGIFFGNVVKELNG